MAFNLLASIERWIVPELRERVVAGRGWRQADSAILLRARKTNVEQRRKKMPEEMHEIHKHAEEGSHEADLAPVTVTMAILAVLIAAVSLLGHRSHTEELLAQTIATDQWAYYQAKDIRRHTYELFLDETSVFALQNSDQIEKVKEKYRKEAERYGAQQKETEAKARMEEDEVQSQRRRSNRFDLGEVLLEAGLVICSITVLTRKQFFWGAGMLVGVLGLAVGAAGLLIR
jgi:hypothetical protein